MIIQLLQLLWWIVKREINSTNFWCSTIELNWLWLNHINWWCNLCVCEPEFWHNFHMEQTSSISINHAFTKNIIKETFQWEHWIETYIWKSPRDLRFIVVCHIVVTTGDTFVVPFLTSDPRQRDQLSGFGVGKGGMRSSNSCNVCPVLVFVDFRGSKELLCENMININ